MRRSPVLILIISFLFFLNRCNTVLEEKSETLFTKMGSVETGIFFVNTNTEDAEQNILTYEYFYNGGGVAVGDINNDGLVDVYFSSNQGENKLYLNKGNFKFEDITQTAGVSAKSGWRTGVAFVDINADGYLDIHVCRSGNQHPLFRTNSLFINNKDLTFTDKSSEYGLDDDSYSTQAAFFDADKDGDLDMFLLNHSRLSISNSFDIRQRYSKDRVRYVGNKFYRNNAQPYGKEKGGKIFHDVSDSVGIYGPASNYGLGIVCADIDNDGWMDVFTSNDYTEKDKALINHRGIFFHEMSDSLFTHISQFSMGVDIADVNNDGLQDIVTLDMLPESNRRQKEFYWPDRYDVYQSMVKNRLHHQYMRNMLQLNNGDGTFSEIGQIAGISNTDWSWAPLLADYDNDGLQDLFVSNGFKRNFTSNDFLRFKADLALKARQGKDVGALNDILNTIPSNKAHNYMFQNVNGLLFKDTSADWGFSEETLTNGAAYADLDNDGDLDLILNNIDGEAGIFRNNSDRLKYHYLKIKLRGNDNNTFGLGGKVTLYGDSGKLMTRTLCPYRGFQSSVEPVLFFGLGKETRIDSLLVEWPRGESQTLKNLAADQTLTLQQSEAIQRNVISREHAVIFFTERKNSIPFRHKENDFIDFKNQGLLPRMYSTQGPPLATADVNHDGLMDIFIGGAKGQAGSLLFQDKNGSYKEKPGSNFIQDKDCEDVDAVFFDMDNDGDEDLYIVSGGYEYSENDVLLQDRLYRNDGNGNFKKVHLPEFRSSGSCARPADVDSDGDLDLFVGGRIIPGRYPEAPESFLLINDGKGNFSIAEKMSSLDRIGMVTDAVWTDVNNDSQPDLIVVGEWMPVSIFINNDGTLINKTEEYLQERTDGWWNCILAEDFDRDGDKDLVVGNFGMNNQFKPSQEKQMTVYFADYDQNGSVDPIINYFIGNKSYPLPTRDELTDQVPMFKKRFTDYKSYTDVTIERILTTEELKRSGKLIAYRFETTYFKNDGNRFTRMPLPHQTQFAPVFALAAMDVNHDGNLDIVTGGNLSAMGTRFGKASGNFGGILLGDGSNGFKFLRSLESGLCIRGDVRRMVVDGNRLIVSVNKESPVVFELKQ